jgi:hypothetical protein
MHAVRTRPAIQLQANRMDYCLAGLSPRQILWGSDSPHGFGARIGDFLSLILVLPAAIYAFHDRNLPDVDHWITMILIHFTALDWPSRHSIGRYPTACYPCFDPAPGFYGSDWPYHQSDIGHHVSHRIVQSQHRSAHQ